MEHIQYGSQAITREKEFNVDCGQKLDARKIDEKMGRNDGRAKDRKGNERGNARFLEHQGYLQEFRRI